MSKQITTIYVLFTFFIASNALADGDTIRLNNGAKEKAQYYPQPLILKTNPLAVLWGPIPFTSEYRLVAEICNGRTKSIQAGISYLDKSPLLGIAEKLTTTTTNYLIKVNGWRLQFAYRFYLVNKRKYAPFGFYIAPNISFSDAHVSIGLSHYYRNQYYDFRHFNSTLQIGVQIGRYSNITMDIFAGLGYKKNVVLYHANDAHILTIDTKEFGDLYNMPLKLVFGLNFGYTLY